MTDWLNLFALLSLGLAVLCALIITVDIVAGHRQRMWIMNLVWPITALYSGPLALWAYFRIGRQSSKEKTSKKNQRGGGQGKQERPMWQSAALGATHCGSGCTLGDLIAEWGVLFFPISLFGKAVFGTWVVDFILAFLFGVAFQYFTIKPMRNLSVGEGLVAALKADTLSLTAWQVGMYGWMAVVIFGLFGHELSKTDPRFWFMMQVAMLFGFLTSYPVNWWLIRKGIKEAM
jgi:hypothetical protein